MEIFCKVFVSQILTEELKLPEANCRLSDAKAQDKAQFATLIVLGAFWRSNLVNRTVQSCEAESKRLPSGEKSRELTQSE